MYIIKGREYRGGALWITGKAFVAPTKLDKHGGELPRKAPVDSCREAFKRGEIPAGRECNGELPSRPPQEAIWRGMPEKAPADL